jgi:serine/threonine protein kinase
MTSMVSTPSYFLSKKVGSGTFGTVYLGCHKTSGTQVAVKCVLRNKISQRQRAEDSIVSEIEILKRLEDQHLGTFQALHHVDSRVIKLSNLVSFINLEVKFNLSLPLQD